MDKGSISQIPVIRLFISIFEKGSTGVLYLKKEVTEGSLKVLYFNRGKFYSAISNADVDKLDNILLAKKLVNEFTLKEINEEENITESKGKILVEKGIVTLEQLIDCTKEQFKSIVLDVLKWNEGRFQFIEELLPEGLLNLDINILNFVFNYITQVMDISLIESQMHSLPMKLRQNPDIEKLNKYNLNEKQKALLQRFNGNSEMKEILSSYPEEHRDSILRIIHFFYITELIIQTEKKTDSRSISPEKKDHPIYLEPKPTARPDTFVFGKKNQPGDEVPIKPQRTLFPVNIKDLEDKKKSKHFSWIFIFIIFILVIAGIIFLLLWQGSPFNKKTGTVTDKDIVSAPEATHRVDKVDERIVVQMKKPGTAETGPESRLAGPEKKMPEQISPDVKTEPSDQAVVKTERKSVSENRARDYFKEGDFLKACDAWKEEIKIEKVTHSILLELDCLKESVLNAYSRIDQKDAFFILKRELNNRACFLVFWGKFRSVEKAGEGLKDIPPYFWNQSTPPKVMDLDKYL